MRDLKERSFAKRIKNITEGLLFVVLFFSDSLNLRLNTVRAETRHVVLEFMLNLVTLDVVL